MGISGEVPTGLPVLQCYILIFVVARITWLNGSTIAEAGTVSPMACADILGKPRRWAIRAAMSP